MKTIHKYEIHPREYTMVGISAPMQEFFTPKFRKYFGTELKEIVSLIKNGQYYHIQIEGDRERIDRCFLDRVNKNKVDLKKEYERLLILVTDYEKLIATSQKNYSLNMILDFYKLYRDLIVYNYIGFDTPDFIDHLKLDKRKIYMKWATKVRLRLEKVYKDGEMMFMPKYLDWLSKNYFPRYSFKELRCLFFEELIDFAKKEKPIPTKKVLVQRNKIFLVRHSPKNRYKLFEREAAEKEIVRRQYFREESLGDIGQLTGQVSYKGHAKGKVRMVLKLKDMVKFKKDEILVSVMTVPSYLPVMKKAKAFITDEGGILCHAAIVARELKKPCIIGTKIATKVLHDGDLVEVDANKGIVKIIKKAK